MPKKPYTPPPFLVDLLDARSPSGYETEAQAVFDKYIRPVASTYEMDSMGNRIASINPGGDPTIMLAGHMDELGLIINYVDDKGFLYFNIIGGQDLGLLAGRRVSILTENGVVKGVTGKRAVHLLTQEERKQVPKIKDIWIDIGAKNKRAALGLVRIGDVATFDQSFELLRGTVAVARAFDNKVGAYVVGETLLRLSRVKTLKAKVTAVATAQEEIGCRGVITAAYSVNPQLAIAVDVGHATDHPDCDNRKFGEFKQGSGPIITRGPNINPFVFDRLMACAKTGKIPHQVEADPRPTGTDGRQIQISREGVATGVVSVPLRYMHTPSEVVDLQDIENCVKLLTAFAKSIKKGEHGQW